jgi:hypothetical protein
MPLPKTNFLFYLLPKRKASPEPDFLAIPRRIIPFLLFFVLTLRFQVIIAQNLQWQKGASPLQILNRIEDEQAEAKGNPLSQKIEIQWDKKQVPNLKKGHIFWDGIPVYNSSFLEWGEKEQANKSYLLPDLDWEKLKETASPSQLKGKNWFWVNKNGAWELAQRLLRKNEKGKTATVFDYYSLEGDWLFSEDWLMQSGKDSLVDAAVFRPDPVSRLRMHYGSLLKDRSDSNSVLLTRALDTVAVFARFEGDSFCLKSPYFQFGEYSNPIRPRAVSSLPKFLFTREDSRFEEVNAYFHLHAFRRYVDNLGFDTLCDFSIRVDAHGLDGADMSAYSPGENLLVFGEGNVDDAEDGAVIVHEYGHALMQKAISFGNMGTERKTVEEGLCDYLAGSYVKNQSDFEWQNVFKWDGHNEFWAGRNLVNSKVYPSNLVGQIHKDGEIFSAFLMQLELSLGRNHVHKILFSMAPFLLPNMSMPQAAQLFQKVDSSLNGTSNYALISQKLMDKGLHPSQIIVSSQNNFSPRNQFQILDIQTYADFFLLENKSKEMLNAFLVDQNSRVLGSVFKIQPGQKTRLSKSGLAPGLYGLKWMGETGNGVRKIILLPN